MVTPDPATTYDRGTRGGGGGDRKYNPDGYGCRKRMALVPVLLALLPLFMLLALIRRPR